MRKMFDVVMGTMDSATAHAQTTFGSDDDDDDDAALRKHYRTIFISDIRLGTPGCQAAALLDFFKSPPERQPVSGRRHC